LAAGAEPQIHGEGDAGRGDVAQLVGQTLDGRAVERVDIDAQRTIRLAILAEDHEDVEVRARHELPSPQLAHSDHHAAHEPTGGRPRPTVTLDEILHNGQPARTTGHL